jgi:hypothetical protein
MEPSAYTILGGYDAQVLQSVQYKPQTISTISAGTTMLEIDAAYLVRPGVDRLAISAQSPLLPETFITPAVSFGVRDIANSAGAFRRDGYFGRGYYLVMTKSLDNNVHPPQIHQITLTGGLGTGSILGLFGGVSVGLPFTLLGTAEYDSRRMNYRIALPLGKVSNLSFDRIDGANFVGFELHTRLPS